MVLHCEGHPLRNGESFCRRRNRNNENVADMKRFCVVLRKKEVWLWWLLQAHSTLHLIVFFRVRAIDLLRINTGTSPTSMIARAAPEDSASRSRSEEHTSELQSRGHLVCRLLL